jgi:hypothetical protein
MYRCPTIRSVFRQGTYKFAQTVKATLKFPCLDCYCVGAAGPVIALQGVGQAYLAITSIRPVQALEATNTA